MFVRSNALAHVVGFMIELALIFLGQVTVVRGHIFLFVVLQALFAFFQVRRLPRRELSVFYAVGDVVLLVGLTRVYLIHAWMAGIDLPCSRTGCVAVLGLSSGRADKKEGARCQE